MAKYGLNQVTLIGNLGKDPELRYLDQGIAATSLWLACTESYRDRNGNNADRTEWISVNLWRSQAEIAAKYCRKGSTVCIEGRLTSRSWETPQGETRRVTEVEGRRIILLDSAPARPNELNTPVQQSYSQAATQAAAQSPSDSDEKQDDGLPF
ncbi:MAG: single-stranded DNA-binding protein [Bacteroidia bacterium]|nr:single-stranded DNA-binding protein [Bacteroidia bacterium]